MKKQKNILENLKHINLKYIHIGIIILGILFICIPVFHSSMWFDESYSVAISNNHNFLEIWQIGGHDVHPVFYYWMLKIISLIFGNNILCYRLMSVLAIAVLGILGYTHIRKDFGEKVGALFSLFVFTFPTNIVYAGEIRMYTWAMLFVVIMAIYAYRIYKKEKNSKIDVTEEANKTNKKEKIKNWIIFAVFSLLSAYTHYYGLMAAGIINIILFIWVLKDVVKQRKCTFNLKAFIVQAIIEIALYLPWVVSLLLQVSQVSNGFWIGVKFPDTLIEIFTFQFSGNLGGTKHIPNAVAGIYGIIFLLYIMYCVISNIRKYKKTQKDNKIKECSYKNMEPAKLAIIIYAAVILGAIVVSLIIRRPIIYARYLLVVTGLLIFTFAYIMAKIGNKIANIVIIIATIMISVFVNIDLAQINYDKTNEQPLNYVKENIQDGDIFVYENDFTGFVISANLPQYKQYFWDRQNWGVDEAYKAYGSNMETVHNLDFLKDYKGRIWFMNAGSFELLEAAQNEYDDLKVIKQIKFDIKYQDLHYSFALVERN